MLKNEVAIAKEKLGDRNAELIMDALGVTEWDSRNLKCRCPFHDEDTASFIYDRKTFRFHCFGACDVSVDVIDALMRGKHLTFNQAAEKIFREADISTPMGMVGVKSNQKYRYPTLAEEMSDVAYEYLARRKISKETADYLGLKADSKNNIEFPFYDENDVLTMVKCRPARKVPKDQPKCWVKKDTDSSPILFNMNRLNPDETLVITEGLIDCASVIECGYYNVVSVPLGAGNTHWIEKNLEWLDRFPDYVICGDNDTAGSKMNTEVSSRLGIERCRIFQHPTYEKDGKLYKINDLNECLYRLGNDTLRRLVDECINAPNPHVVDFTEIEDVDWSQVDGISFALDTLDATLGKMYRGSVNTYFAKPSAGKSSYINQVIADAINDNRKVFLYTGELSEQLWKNWFNFTLAGRRNIASFRTDSGYEYYKVSPKAITEINKHCKDKLFVYRDDENSHIDKLYETCVDLIRRKGVMTLVFDNLMTIDCDAKGGELEEQKVIMKKLAKLARDYNVVVILVCHSKKVKEALTMEDASGSMKIANLSGVMITLERNTDKTDNSHDVLLKVQKDRFNGKNGYQFPVRFDFPSRRFFTTEEELNKVYSWDKGLCKTDNPPASESLARMRMAAEEDAELFGEVQDE